MSNFWQRFLVVITLGTAISFGLYNSEWFFFGFFMLLAFVSSEEYSRLVHNLHEDKPYKFRLKELWIVLSAAGMFVLPFGCIRQWWSWEFLFLIPLFIWIVVFLELIRRSTRALLGISLRTFGWLYIGSSLFCLPFLVYGTDGYDGKLMMSCLLLIWMYDTGAYVFGKTIGRRKAFPNISPGKTFEGLAGGVLVDFAVAYGLFLWNDSYGLIFWIGLMLVTVIFAIAGDLAESLMKRNLQIKDSGSLIPGHGGMLDRFDAFFMAIPFMTAYIKIVPLLGF